MIALSLSKIGFLFRLRWPHYFIPQPEIVRLKRYFVWRWSPI